MAGDYMAMQNSKRVSLHEPMNATNFVGTLPVSSRLREFTRLLRRRSKLILITLLIANTISFFALRALPSRYTAEASVLIGPRQAQVLDLKAVVSGLSGESDVIESEIQLLRSPQVARRVTETLGLDSYPEFNPMLAPAGWLKRTMASGLRWWTEVTARLPEPLRLLTPSRKTISNSQIAATAEQDPLEASTDSFQRHVWIAPKGHSRVIGITVDSADPNLAAHAANAMAEIYIQDQLQQKLDATEHAHRWLEDRVAEMRTKVIDADKAVESFREKMGLTGGRSGPIVEEQISLLTDQIVRAEVDAAAASAKLQAAEAAPHNARSLGSGREMESSPVSQLLRAQEGLAAQQAAEVSRIYGDNNPKSLEAFAKLAAVRDRISSESVRTTSAMRDDQRVSSLRLSIMRAELDRLKIEATTDKSSEAELHALQHEADANRGLYDRLLARSKETNVESGLQEPDAQLISRAVPPTMPSFPNIALMTPIFFLASCLLAALLVVGIENLDHGFTNLEQVEQAMGIVALGLVPMLRTGLFRRRPIEFPPNRQEAAFNEAIRSLHTSLMLSDVACPPKVVLIASSLPNEGKTSIALSLGRLLASVGKRVLIIDCDLHRPSLHTAFKCSQSPGLTDCLAGEQSIADVLQHDLGSPAMLVPAGSFAQTAPDLFASAKMQELIEKVRREFDLVILDSAPVLATSDTRILCRLVDKTVFVMRWQATRMFAAAPALRQLLDAGGDVAGALLSMVDMRSYSRYSDSGQYHRGMQIYLTKHS